MNPESIYVHVPFCVSKCPYCAFASAVKREGDEELYLDSLSREMELRRLEIWKIKTLYIGGGTPSALSPRSWDKLVRLLDENFSFEPGAEVTAEANPGSLSPEHLALWSEWRINRVSIGAQSFEDGRLAFLGRTHCAAQAKDAAESCANAGFSVSLDMMFGLPGETLRDWMTDLREAISAGSSHISVYQLAIESGTPFAGRDLPLPEGYAQYRYAQWRLPRSGYSQYEVASFSKAGHESRHNLNYWNDGEYAGFGPSAWSHAGGARFRNAPSLNDYASLLASSPVVFSERIEGERAARQAAVLALRTNLGIDWVEFSKRYGTRCADAIRRDLSLLPPDLIVNEPANSRHTAKGLRLGNAIWARIV
ncbi:MAG: radical SAM family heme chaperone HemW [Synergistaceae bacterium]|jgi:oxygen-independent coproporphyrinogen-3 oxidase|nr:radical SAM family heme chaperone HemW [Synergistaceae bacterium]